MAEGTDIARLTIVAAKEGVAVLCSQAAVRPLLSVLKRNVHVAIEAGKETWKLARAVKDDRTG